MNAETPICPVERGEIGIIHAHVADLKNARDKSAHERISELEDIVLEALPYVEDAINDPAFKKGVVAKVAKRMREAIENQAKGTK